MPMNKPGGRLRVTDADTIALARRLAQHYDDQAIAAILAKQRRRTATALAFTRARVATLRAEHAIPVYQPPAQHDVGSLGDDADVVTITEAQRRLGVSKATLYRGSVKALSPPNKSPLARPGASASTRPCEAAKALDIARQTVLHKVQRGQLQAVHVNRGRRKGLRIEAKPDQHRLFDTP
jgi:hypothetical protein